DVLLEVRVFSFLEYREEEQRQARWFVVPSAFISCGAFLVMLLRESERSEREIMRSNTKLETIVTSLNDTVFEINDQLRVLNIWTDDERKLPLPREVYLSHSVTEVLPPP